MTIARREIAAALASPVAYVLFGAFAFLYGYFFADYLQSFVEAGMRMSQMGGFSGGTLNVNGDLIRWLMASTAILVLFLLPLLSMRTVSEEIRSGTMELLLTAPITDGQIVIGKFLAAFALYGGMLALTGLHLGVLFWFSRPEIAPVLAAYLGLLLLGAGLLALGDLGRVLAYLSVTGHMEGFARGVIATRDLVFYLSFTAFWLFLARESVRSRRWRG